MVFLQAETSAGMLGPLLPFILMIAVFYFFLIRPQQQQQRKRKEMLDSLKAGDKVITVGGIHGEITAVKDDTVQLRIADKVEIRMSRQGIGHVKGRE
ncbi:MAG: preprotein translocase subunit YajC [Limnochordales bacterium]|nr:preprotein translocase subunit YajC [Limnochordales bacterium]